jgi:hypothetical protein
MPRKFDIGDDSGFAVLPENIYAFRVKNVETCEAGPNSKNPGAEGYNVTHEVIDDDQHTGRLFWNRFWFLPQNGWTWVRFLSAILPEQDWKGEVEIPDCYDLIGLKGKAHLVVAQYKNANGIWVEKNEVKNSEYYPYSGELAEASTDWKSEPF